MQCICTNKHCSQVTQVKTLTFLLLGFPQRGVQARHKHLVSMITEHRLEGQQAVCCKASLVTKTHHNTGRAAVQLTPVQHQILSNILIFITLEVSQSHQNWYECYKARRSYHHAVLYILHPHHPTSRILPSPGRHQSSRQQKQKHILCMHGNYSAEFEFDQIRTY